MRTSENSTSLRIAAKPTPDRFTADADERVAARFGLDAASLAPRHEETLVVDDRMAISPAQMVESKLMRILEGSSLPVSHLQMRGILRNR